MDQKNYPKSHGRLRSIKYKKVISVETTYKRPEKNTSLLQEFPQNFWILTEHMHVEWKWHYKTIYNDMYIWSTNVFSIVLACYEQHSL